MPTKPIVFYETVRSGPSLNSVDVSTFDGFLETCHRLPASTNFHLMSRIRDVAETPHMAYRQEEGFKLLSRRRKKREQARSFVHIMGWATDAEDKSVGLGFSDGAMDWSEGYNETGGAELAAATGGGSTFWDALESKNYPLRGRCEEQIWWAGRYWVKAGRPKLSSVQLWNAMKKVGLLPVYRKCEDVPRPELSSEPKEELGNFSFHGPDYDSDYDSDLGP